MLDLYLFQIFKYALDASTHMLLNYMLEYTNQPPVTKKDYAEHISIIILNSAASLFTL